MKMRYKVGRNYVKKQLRKSKIVKVFVIGFHSAKKCVRHIFYDSTVLNIAHMIAHKYRIKNSADINSLHLNAQEYNVRRFTCVTHVKGFYRLAHGFTDCERARDTPYGSTKINVKRS